MKRSNSLVKKYKAVLDIGTNSFHLIVVKVEPTNEFKIIHREREVLRLTEISDKNGKIISEKLIEKAVLIIQEYKDVALTYNAELHVVATSAVRESVNRNEFCEKVFRKTGVMIEVLEGKREAELIYRGVKEIINLRKENSLIIDIGGGSTEFIYTENGEANFICSVEIGAVTLMQRFFSDQNYSEEKILIAKTFANNKFQKSLEKIKGESVNKIIGTSGTVLNICKILLNKNIETYEIDKCEISSDELNKIENNIYHNAYKDNLKSLKGINKDRIDIITTGVMILSTIFEILRTDKMIFSKHALKEGVIAESLMN